MFTLQSKRSLANWSIQAKWSYLSLPRYLGCGVTKLDRGSSTTQTLLSDQRKTHCKIPLKQDIHVEFFVTFFCSASVWTKKTSQLSFYLQGILWCAADCFLYFPSLRNLPMTENLKWTFTFLTELYFFSINFHFQMFMLITWIPIAV